MSSEVSIPKRSLFKPAEVCSIAGVQPYILRSWEAEFQTLGRGKKKEGARVYRRADVQMVLRIKKLVFGEGLTLGAARRKIEAEAAPEQLSTDHELLGDLFEADARERLDQVKQGLRSILEMLSTNGHGATHAAQGPEPKKRTVRPRIKRPGKTPRKKSA